jgi:flagellin-like hook-associated protein FlgL
MQAAFNQNSTAGTPSVFTLLATLRDTMNNEPASIQSQRPINVTGQTIQGVSIVNGAPVTDANPTTLKTIAGLGPPVTTPMTTVPLTPDNGVPPGYSIAINGTSPTTGVVSTVTLNFLATTPVDDGVPPPGGTSVVAMINAQTATTGVTASFNVATQRLQLTSSGPNSPPFSVDDVVSPGATKTSNFLAAFQIPNQVSITSNLSTQIGDIDDVINQVLSARAGIGQQIQNLAMTTGQLQVLSNDNTTTKSTIEDTNVPQAASQFTLTQTALQAAYATTSRLEGKTLIDYL